MRKIQICGCKRVYIHCRRMMETTTAIALLITFGRISNVLLTEDFIKFSKIDAFNGLMCPASQNIFNTTEVRSKIQCTLYCIAAHSCFGVFHQPQTKECFGCNSFTIDEALSHEGTWFYGRVPGPNVAEGKQATMSSVSIVYTDYGGDKGVDGNTNQNLFAGSCFHTIYENNPWWRVDLGATYGIAIVKLYNILNSGGIWKARDLRLSIGTSLVSMEIVGTVPGQIDDIHTFNFSPDIEGQYVQVTLIGQNILHLCEIQVFGFPV